MWLATIIFKKKFSKTEIAAGEAALPMGLVGITEGALPFAFRTPLRAIASNMSGAIVAGALVTLFQINFYGGLGSPLGAWIGFSTHNFYGLTWIISILSGATVTGLMYGLLRNHVPEYAEMHKKSKEDKKENYKKLGLINKKQIFKHHMIKKIKGMGPKLIYCINPIHWFANPNQTDEHEI